MTNQNEPNTYQIGVWTPIGKLICRECHGPKFPRRTFNTEATEWVLWTMEYPLIEHSDVTKCSDCGREIQTADTLALEQNLMLELRSYGIAANLAQTGGMCSAVEIMSRHTLEEFNEGKYVTYMFTAEGLLYEDGAYELSRFNSEYEWDEHYRLSAKTREEFVKLLVDMKDKLLTVELEEQYTKEEK